MSLGVGQILLLLIIVLIIFGAGKLPQVMKDLAKGVKAFKEGLQEEEKPASQSLSKATPKRLKKTSSK